MIKNVFPTKIWEATYPGYNKEEAVEKFDSYIKKVGSHKLNYHIADTDTTAPPYQAKDVTSFLQLDHDFPEMSIEDLNISGLWPWINQQIMQYHNHCGYENPDRYKIIGWVNSAPKGGHIVLHNHNPSRTSGVFYVDAEPEQGNLYLLNPNEAVVGKVRYQLGYEYDGKWHEFKVKSGKLILFPGYLYHQAPKNLTDNRRRLISFDV